MAKKTILNHSIILCQLCMIQLFIALLCAALSILIIPYFLYQCLRVSAILNVYHTFLEISLGGQGICIHVTYICDGAVVQSTVNVEPHLLFLSLVGVVIHQRNQILQGGAENGLLSYRNSLIIKSYLFRQQCEQIMVHLFVVEVLFSAMILQHSNCDNT